MFAHGKRYVMRAPVRLWHELFWNSEEHVKHSRGSGKRSSDRFKDALNVLEKQGFIRRFPGGIEILKGQ